ncbi:MAG: hypothetical protein SPJ04_02495, partial [Bdellovibrionota bacterium]|nr:hypothetical protein [Bdellovibrionota bacterium]
MSSNLQISETQKKYTESKNAFRLYKDLIVGDNKSYITLLAYEFLVFFANLVPSIFGIALRMFVYKIFLKKLGKRPYFGKNVEIRNPSKISIGNKA